LNKTGNGHHLTGASGESTREGTRRARWLSLVWMCAVFAGVALSYHFFFLKTFDHWWVDDDPRNFAVVRSVSNPLSFFTDPPIARNFSSTNTVNPMLALSIWLDTRLADRNFRFAQLHNVLILTATLCLLFLILRRCGLSSTGAFATSLIWLFLPATGIVSEWLAARHHLEGFTWSLAAVLVAQKLVQREWLQNAWSIGLLLLLVGFAALSKETSAITVAFGLSLYLWHRGRRHAAISCVALFLAYVGYRSWLVGFTAGEGHYLALPSALVFAHFLARLPYIFTGNSGGYLLVALAILAAIMAAARGQLRLRPIFYTIAVIASCLTVVCRGALPLYREWLDPGTWYRIVFFLESGLLIGAAYLIARMPAPHLGYIATVVALPIALAGGLVTQKKWDLLSERYEAEGKYYLKYPDRLLYSEVPAGWYLDGIQQLYDVQTRHHVVAGHELPQLAQQLASHLEIWRYADGKFVTDPQLFLRLKAKTEETASTSSFPTH
jgi:hypothetical protein